MRITLAAFVLSLAVIAGCSDPDRPAPVATTTPGLAGGPTAPLIVRPTSTMSPGPAVTGAAAPAPAPTDDEEWTFDDEKPLDDAEFEIHAEASTYFAPAPMYVTFRAKALNGTPPFSFTWNFGDGSPPASGERVDHSYHQVGKITPTVIGRDATGAESGVQFILLFVTPEEYAARMNVDPSQLYRYPSPTPDSTP